MSSLLPVCETGRWGWALEKSARSHYLQHEIWELGRSFFGFPPSHRMYLNKFQQQKLIQGQSGFISLCLGLHVSTGTSNLPTAAFSLSTALFMRFTFLYSLLRKLFKDEYGRNSRCFWEFNAASAQTVEILRVHLFDNVILFIFSLTTTNTTWQW